MASHFLLIVEYHNYNSEIKILKYQNGISNIILLHGLNKTLNQERVKEHFATRQIKRHNF